RGARPAHARDGGEQIGEQEDEDVRPQHDAAREQARQVGHFPFFFFFGWSSWFRRPVAASSRPEPPSAPDASDATKLASGITRGWSMSPLTRSGITRRPSPPATNFRTFLSWIRSSV